MNPTLVFSVLSARDSCSLVRLDLEGRKQQKERQIKRDQQSALYVKFLHPGHREELQTQALNGMLEEDELAFSKKEYPEQYEFGSPYAIENALPLKPVFRVVAA